MAAGLSVIVPNYNGSETIGKCLDALYSSDYGDFEVIVVDDCSDDGSADIISLRPCRLVMLDARSGAARARNRGAAESSGDILFFIDADCIVRPDTVSAAVAACRGHEGTVFGGTYTRTAHDDTFFSTFQSIFINYFETKRSEPDYIASHAMVINRKMFLESGGFPHDFLPIIEDVEFSHRIRRSGAKLAMAPDLLVSHIFNFTLLKSLKNAFRKSRYWTAYSMQNRDLLSDSGTASAELKINVVSYSLTLLMMLLSVAFHSVLFLLPATGIFLFNLGFNRNFLKAFFETKGPVSGTLSTLYYTLLYPAAIAAGSLTGMVEHYARFRRG